jgi:hypothetical protein
VVEAVGCSKPPTGLLQNNIVWHRELSKSKYKLLYIESRILKLYPCLQGGIYVSCHQNLPQKFNEVFTGNQPRQMAV